MRILPWEPNTYANKTVRWQTQRRLTMASNGAAEAQFSWLPVMPFVAPLNGSVGRLTWSSKPETF